MAQYIERAHAVDALIDNTHIVGSDLEDAVNAICKIPAADVAPARHGRWKPFDLTYGRSIYYCTVCNNSAVVPTALGEPIFNFCPNCGASMVHGGGE